MVTAIPLSVISRQIGKVLAKAPVAQSIAKGSFSAAKQSSIEMFGYDFAGLYVKLFIYFTLAFVFAKFMEFVLFARGVFTIIVNLFGFKVPTADQVPDTIKKLFDGGISGFKFWDIVKMVAIFVVIAEYFMYWNANKKNGGSINPSTTMVFALTVIILIITTVPELYQRIKTTDLGLEQFR